MTPYYPMDTFAAAIGHLSKHAGAHARVAVLWVAYSLVVIGAALSVFVGGIAAGIVTEEPGLALAGYFGLFAVQVIAIPIGAILWHGYLTSTLAETEGGDEVSIQAVFRLGFAHVGVVLAFTCLNCSLGVFGLLACYVGTFFVGIPLRYALLVATTNKLGIVKAIELTWQSFMARKKDHSLAFLVYLGIVLVGSGIPVLGMVISMPLAAGFDALTFRQLLPKPPAEVA